MRYILNYLTILSLFAFCARCPDEDQVTDSSITILNNSNSDIVSHYTNNFPNDTLLVSFPYPITVQNGINVNAHSSTKFGGPFEQSFKERPDKILMIYLFSRDTINQVPWEQIKSKYLILKRYDLTLDSLEKRNWIVEYK
jgi:hypothetical protein